MESKKVEIGLTTFFLRKRTSPSDPSKVEAYATIGTRGATNLSLNDLEALVKELRRFANAD